MNLVDVLIVIFLITAIIRGREVGFVRQLCSTVGFFGGLLIGALLEPHLVGLAHSQISRSLITLGTTLGCAFALLTAGEYLGIVLKTRFYAKPLNKVDNILGSVLALVSMIIGVWLSASIVQSLPNPGLQTAVKESRIVSLLTHRFPAAPNIIADISRLIDPNGFPQVFTGSEPRPSDSNVALPDLGALQAAVSKDKASVLKVEGQGCGGIVEGSGFIAADGLVITNAHVVAGIKTPYVFQGNDSHVATVISFDPNLDLAILKVKGITGAILPLNTSSQARGTMAAVLGYPGGGGFTAKSAAVLSEITATGRNIYGEGNTVRDIYEVKADIIPGNSGGPLVATDGSVIGVVFAESTSYSHVGYALQTTKVQAELHQAQAQSAAVSTGSCAE
jgi:S1-C subfamily serine protease